MTHLVRYRTATGEPTAEEVDSLEAAVARVEALRNDDHAEDVHVYAEVPLRFETVVRVSLATDEPEVAPVTPISPDVDADVADVDVAVEPPAGAMPLVPVTVAGVFEPDHESVRKGLFNRA